MTNYETRTLEVPTYDENEGSETLLFVVPRNCLLANAVYAPAGELRGDYHRSRSLSLRGHSEHRSETWLLAGASTGGPEFFLPSGMPQNMRFFAATVGHYLRKGDEVHWYSSGLGLEERDGIADPGGTVEILLEERTVEGELSRERWRECVPDYWVGKGMWIEYLEKPLSSLPPGGGGLYSWEYFGILEEVTDNGFAINVPLGRLGVSSETYEFEHDRLGSFRLLDEPPGL